ncbi:MAG: DNA polymerase III subunit gamma/tau [Pseudomonadota bacterium]
MTYQVLARKWRPKTFADLVGQDHVVRALVNALDQDRVHHAFLFTGTRGVGKTTVARIFARALNCEEGVSSTPCGVCRACVDILEGRFLDLIEVDAASRTKVEDTRELLENVQYAPTSGRFKVYLIDEVHMLSTSSFNALLKTLEEPPPQVKFLFATTDPQKLPVTVLSRCLQFNLKRISQAQIEEYLTSITAQESFEAEPDALKLLANAADGSMRDALSLLDQAVAYGGGQARADDVRAMLGTVQARQLEALLTALCSADPPALWDAAQEMVSHSPDFGRVLGEIAQILHRAALVQVMPSVEDPDPMVQAVARALAPEDLQLYYDICLRGRRDLDLAPDHRCGFEMALLRMLAFKPMASDPSPTGGGQTADGSVVSPASAQPKVSAATASPIKASAEAEPASPPTTTGDIDAARAEARRLAAAIPSGPGGASQALADNPISGSPAIPEQRTAEAPMPTVSSEPAEPAPTQAPSVDPRETPPTPNPAPMAELSSAAPEPKETEPAPPPPEAVTASAAPPSEPALDDGPAAPVPPESWDGIIESLQLKGTAGVLARNSVLQREGQGHYRLTLDQKMEHLHTPQAESRIREGLARYFGRDMRLTLARAEVSDQTPAQRETEANHQRQRDAEAAIAEDPLVKSLQQQMGAEIVPGSVRPRSG